MYSNLRWSSPGRSSSSREEPEFSEVFPTAISREDLVAPAAPIAQVEVADPAIMDKVQTPAPVVQASAEYLRVSASGASEQVPAVQGHLVTRTLDGTTDLTRKQRRSNTEAEPSADVEQDSPVVSEASLEEFGKINATLTEETSE